MKMDKPSAAWRKILLPLGALLLSGVLLFTGLSALKAQAADRAAPQESGVNAPLQQTCNCDYRIDVNVQPPGGLQVDAPNNRYQIVVTPLTLPTETLPQLSVYAELPPGITRAATTTGRWSCATVTNQIDCDYTGPVTTTIDNLIVYLDVSPDVDPIVRHPVDLIVFPNDDPINNSFLIDTIVNSADLEISKTPSSVGIAEESPIQYTLAITNNGPNTVSQVIVVDDIPRDLLSLQPPIPPGYDQDLEQWAIPLLAADEEARITLSFLALPAASGNQVNNTAEIVQALIPGGTTSRPDWDLTNNTDTASVVVGGLEIFKTVTTPGGSTDPITAIVGQPITFTLQVNNPTDLEITGGITVTDQIPVGLDLRFPLPSGSRWDPLTRIYTYRRATLAAQDSFAIPITVIGNASIIFQEEFVNMATVSWGIPLNTVESNEVTFTVFPGGALHVTKNDNLSQVYAGDTFSYTIAVTNTGNVQVNQVVLTDTLSNQLSAAGLYLGGIAVGSCPTSNYCRITLNSPLTPGQKATVRVGARVAPNAVPGSTVINYVDATGVDAQSGARVFSTASDTNVVLDSPVTNMRIAKEVTPSQAKVGETFTFRIDVRNIGDTAVTLVRITDEFEPVLDLVSATTTRGTATLNTGARTLDVVVGTLDPDQRVSIVVTAKVNSTVTVAKIYRNFADVTWAPGGGSLRSTSVPFRVLPSSALPGTGLAFSFPGDPATGASLAQSPTGDFLSGALGLLAVGLGLLAILLLAYSLWARANRPLYAGRVARGGLALVVLALICGVGAALLRPAGAQPAQLASLAGNKPPQASAAPTQIPEPSATPRLPGPAQPSQAGEPALETRPTEALPAPTLEPLPTELAHLAPTPTPLYLPDFPIPTPTAWPSVGPDGGPPDASAVTRIVIPAINVDTIVKYVPFSGSTWLISGLKQEVAWMGDTSWPGLGSNTGLAGHVDLVDGSAGPFWNLKQLTPGDQVIIHTLQKIYTYRVSEQRVVPDTDLSVIAPTDKAQITLITCTNWSSELRTYLERLIVFAEFVQVQAQ